MVELPSVIRNEEDDAVKSGTLRLTLGTQAVAILGVIVTGLDPLLGEAFSSGEKTAIIIATIAFVALAQVADVIGRSWTTAAGTMRAAPLPRALGVKVISPTEDYSGHAVEVTVIGSEERYFVVPSNGANAGPSWHKREALRFDP